jgi:hypothetical protein
MLAKPVIFVSWGPHGLALNLPFTMRKNHRKIQHALWLSALKKYTNDLKRLNSYLLFDK